MNPPQFPVLLREKVLRVVAETTTEVAKAPDAGEVVPVTPLKVNNAIDAQELRVNNARDAQELREIVRDAPELRVSAERDADLDPKVRLARDAAPDLKVKLAKEDHSEEPAVVVVAEVVNAEAPDLKVENSLHLRVEELISDPVAVMDTEAVVASVEIAAVLADLPSVVTDLNTIDLLAKTVPTPVRRDLMVREEALVLPVALPVVLLVVPLPAVLLLPSEKANNFQ